MKRLGRENDVEDVISHPWFNDLGKVEEILSKEIKPHYIPTVKQEDDTSNFDEKFSQLEVAESIIDPS